MAHPFEGCRNHHSALWRNTVEVPFVSVPVAFMTLSRRLTVFFGIELALVSLSHFRGISLYPTYTLSLGLLDSSCSATSSTVLSRAGSSSEFSTLSPLLNPTENATYISLQRCRKWTFHCTFQQM